MNLWNIICSEEEEDNDFDSGSKKHDLSDGEVDFGQEMQNELEAEMLKYHVQSLQTGQGG